MPYFTKKELIMSLCCPVITFLWGCHILLSGFPLIGLVALLIGGVLPVILTLRFKIRTDSYLLIRFIVIVVVYGLNRFFENFGFPGGTSVSDFVLHMIVNVTAVLLQYLAVKDEDVTKGERAVLVLSDPILWWAIYYFVYYMDIILFF